MLNSHFSWRETPKMFAGCRYFRSVCTRMWCKAVAWIGQWLKYSLTSVSFSWPWLVVTEVPFSLISCWEQNTILQFVPKHILCMFTILQNFVLLHKPVLSSTSWDLTKCYSFQQGQSCYISVCEIKFSPNLLLNKKWFISFFPNRFFFFFFFTRLDE